MLLMPTNTNMANVCKSPHKIWTAHLMNTLQNLLLYYDDMSLKGLYVMICSN